MPKQYNSEIEKELHLTRLSIERIEKMLKEVLAMKFRDPKEVKKNEKKYKPLEPDENLMREIMRQEEVKKK
tara:strand:+ start:1726 stop:1938 length:213 start_codon:yes stop_codon:yes gene_type:complete